MRKLLLTFLLVSVPLALTACGDGGDETPIGAAPDDWTWVDVPGTECGNGEQTGIGVNPNEGSTDLYLYLQGGGACWDEQTCFVLRSASNLTTGYQAAQFETDSARKAYMFDRTEGTNPFRGMSYVFVPYCTGDVHGGNAVRTYGSREVHHKGASNMEAVLPRLVAAFPGVKRVFLAGSSAGAFGAQLNYERVATAFPGAEVHVLADSGQMVTPAGTLLSTWLTNWGVTIPAACTGCATDFTRFPAYLADTYPASRFGLLAWSRDGVLSSFFGDSGAAFETKTLELLSSSYDGKANARYFLKRGTRHTFLGSLDTTTSTTGVALEDWARQWVDGGTSWSNVLEP